MLTAHLPSGYVLGKILTKRLERDHQGQAGAMMKGALIGAMVPDLDMLYFHFVNHGHTHHHLFITHWPLAWLALAIPVLAGLSLRGTIRARNAAMAFFAGVLLHLLLDSVAGPIFWLLPFAPGRVELFHVPAAYSHWVLSYLLHWTFLFELAIWGTAAMLYVRGSWKLVRG